MRLTHVLLALASAGVASTVQAASSVGGNWYVMAQSSGYAYSYDPYGRFGYPQSQSFRDNECNGPGCPSNSGTTSNGPIPWTRSSSTTTVASSSGNATGIYASGDPRYDGGTSASAFSSVNLSTGEIKMSHDAVRAGAANASASFVDYLHFDPATITSPTTITVDLRVDGTFEGFTQPRFSFSLCGYSDCLSTGIVGWSDSNPNGPSTTATANFIDFGGATGRHGNWQVYGPDRFRGTFVLDPRFQNFADLSIAMSLSAGGVQGEWSAFDHTAAISFELPSGVQFSSASGAFLTANAGPAVPEPATWATLIAGFGLFGGAMRRRGRLARA